MRNKHLALLFFIGIITLSACEEKPKSWVYSHTINLGGIAPIGMIADGDEFWLSDVDGDRLVKIDKTGKILQEVTGLVRPMHIDGDSENIYIPQFGADNIVRWIMKSHKFDTIHTFSGLDAPGGVALGSGMITVADFFNHRVLVNKQDTAFIIGKEGHDNGFLYYPTDIKITADYIYIADAYNNRVEVYDHLGNYVRTIGWQEGIKVATGVEVGNQQIFITDFHGNRLLIYDIYGQLLQTFADNLDNPTDALFVDNTLYVVNFKGHSLSVYELK
jgi:6-bladed beta-propeller protein